MLTSILSVSTFHQSAFFVQWISKGNVLSLEIPIFSVRIAHQLINQMRSFLNVILVWICTQMPIWNNDETMQFHANNAAKYDDFHLNSNEQNSLWTSYTNIIQSMQYAKIIHLAFNEQTHSLWMEFHNSLHIGLSLNLYSSWWVNQWKFQILYSHFWQFRVYCGLKRLYQLASAEGSIRSKNKRNKSCIILKIPCICIWIFVRSLRIVGSMLYTKKLFRSVSFDSKSIVKLSLYSVHMLLVLVLPIIRVLHSNYTRYRFPTLEIGLEQNRQIFTSIKQKLLKFLIY